MLSVTSISRFGCAYGSGRINAASTNAKIATLAPIPSASISIAVTANPGARPICRIANRKSCATVSMRNPITS